MIGLMIRTILIVTNREPLGAVISRIVQRRMGEGVGVLRLTYADCASMLTPHLLTDTGLFILELLREYPGGLRAEGVTLARRLIKRGKQVLVVSPLYMAEQLNCHMYWDASSTDDLGIRIKQIIEIGRTSVTETEKLLKAFASLLDLPPQHSS